MRIFPSTKDYNPSGYKRNIKSGPLLSIVIPTYNSDSTLKNALVSILDQSFREFEIIIIDGLSTDNTLEISRSYQRKFPNIRVISDTDEGIYDAMNKGIEMAKGEWLYFMGSDDSLYKPETLHKVSSHLKSNLFDVVYGNVISKRFNGIYDGEFTYDMLANKNICHQAIFFRRKVFDKTGKFDTNYPALADWDHNIKWFYSSRFKRKYVDQIIANYADGGFSSDGDEKFRQQIDVKLLKRGLGKISFSKMVSICRNALRNTDPNKRSKVLLLHIAKICFTIANRFKKTF